MKVINCLTLGEICEAALDGEPVFVLRAKDKAILETLEYYRDTSTKLGGKNAYRVNKAIARIVLWQKENVSKMKVAD